MNVNPDPVAHAAPVVVVVRGVSADAEAVIAPLVAWVRDAPRTVGLTAQLH